MSWSLSSIIYLIISLGWILTTANALVNLECDIMQIYLEGIGLSIYAGRYYNERESLEMVVGFPALTESVSFNELENYGTNI